MTTTRHCVVVNEVRRRVSRIRHFLVVANTQARIGGAPSSSFRSRCVRSRRRSPCPPSDRRASSSSATRAAAICFGVLRSPGAGGVNVLVRSASRPPPAGGRPARRLQPVAAAPVLDRLEALRSSAAAGGATSTPAARPGCASRTDELVDGDRRPPRARRRPPRPRRVFRTRRARAKRRGGGAHRGRARSPRGRRATEQRQDESVGDGLDRRLDDME